MVWYFYLEYFMFYSFDNIIWKPLVSFHIEIRGPITGFSVRPLNKLSLHKSNTSEDLIIIIIIIAF